MKNNGTAIAFDRCQPVDPSHLYMQMGSMFDDSRMALDKEGVRKASLRERSVDDSDDDDEVGDVDDFSVLDSESDRTSKIGSFDSLIDSISNPKSEKINSRGSRRRTYPDDSTQYRMRRRRSARDDFEEDELVDDIDDSDWSDYKKIMLYQSRYGHPRVKREKGGKFRSKNRLPWSCKFKKKWVEMQEGYFPQFILSGKCKSKMCYYKTKECIPKKYTIQILKRDPNRCNPLPNVGLSTAYEEAWLIERKHVTVWCECGNTNNKNKKRRGKSRNRGKSRKNRPR